MSPINFFTKRFKACKKGFLGAGTCIFRNKCSWRPNSWSHPLRDEKKVPTLFLVHLVVWAEGAASTLKLNLLLLKFALMSAPLSETTFTGTNYMAMLMFLFIASFDRSRHQCELDFCMDLTNEIELTSLGIFRSGGRQILSLLGSHFQLFNVLMFS